MLNQGKKFLFAATLSLACAGAVFASGYDDCQKAIRDQVHQNNSKVEKVVFHSDSESNENKSRSETVYKGEGEFQRHTGKWEKFAWECSFNTQRDVVNSAHYSVQTYPDAGSPVPALKDLVGARGGQAEGDLKRRGYHWKKSDGAYSYWVEDSTNYCVTIRTDDGRYKSIVYAMEIDCKK